MATEGAVKLAMRLDDFGEDPEFVAANADLIDSALKELVEAAWVVYEEECDYVRINNLGNPEDPKRYSRLCRLRTALQPWLRKE